MKPCKSKKFCVLRGNSYDCHSDVRCRVDQQSAEIREQEEWEKIVDLHRSGQIKDEIYDHNINLSKIWDHLFEEGFFSDEE